MTKYAALKSQYVIKNTIGKGGFAKVKLGVHIATGETVAIKIIKKSKNSSQACAVRREIEAMKSLKHQNICQLYQFIETDNYFFLILEYVKGGDLFDFVMSRGYLGENEARDIFGQILAALGYAHEMGYAHRDIKLENILIDVNRNVKVIDFGLCANPKGGMSSLLRTECGSDGYMAPEIFEGNVYLGAEVDLWSMGIVLHVMLTGELPFDFSHFTAISEQVNSLKGSIPKRLSPTARDLILNLLQFNSEDRINLQKVAFHPWMTFNWIGHPVDCTSKYNRTILDESCVTEMAVLYKMSIKKMSEEIERWSYDDITATYLLLLLKKNRPTTLSQIVDSRNLKRTPFVPRKRSVSPDFSCCEDIYDDDEDDEDVKKIGQKRRKHEPKKRSTFSKDSKLKTDAASSLSPVKSQPDDIKVSVDCAAEEPHIVNQVHTDFEPDIKPASPMPTTYRRQQRTVSGRLLLKQSNKRYQRTMSGCPVWISQFGSSDRLPVCRLSFSLSNDSKLPSQSNEVEFSFRDTELNTENELLTDFKLETEEAASLPSVDSPSNKRRLHLLKAADKLHQRTMSGRPVCASWVEAHYTEQQKVPSEDSPSNKRRLHLLKAADKLHQRTMSGRPVCASWVDAHYTERHIAERQRDVSDVPTAVTKRFPVIGGFEKKMGRILNMFTPKKRLTCHDKPRVAEIAENVCHTSRRGGAELLDALISVICRNGIGYQLEGYTLKCTGLDTAGKKIVFDLEIVEVTVHKAKLTGIVHKRIKGERIAYTELYRKLMNSMKV